MTINMASSSSGSALSVMNSSKTSIVQSKTELNETEKKYDYDNDGVLSIQEKAAMTQAESQKQTLKDSNSESGVSVSISPEAKKMQMQEPHIAMDVSEMSDEDLKNMVKDLKEKYGGLPKELSDYKESNIDDLTSEDLSSIRKSMTEMQDKMKERMNSFAESSKKNSEDGQSYQQKLLNSIIAQYKSFSS